MLWLIFAQLASAGNGQVLVYGPAYDENWERAALNKAGYDDTDIIVVSAATWSTYKKADFDDYDMLWIGDNACSIPSASDMSALKSSQAEWLPAMTGRVVVSGADAGCHGTAGAQKFLDNTAVWLKGGGSTGGYFNAWGVTNFDFLSSTGIVGSNSGVYGDDYEIVTSHPVHAGQTSADMSNWYSTWHSHITTVPSGWDVIGRQKSATGNAITIVREETCADADGDGFQDVTCGGSDCDDSTASVNPGAAELCSTVVDDDCDGTINEDDATDASTWYRDADSDEFGNAAITDAACTQPSGYVADATDCDDSDPLTFPGAAEVVGDAKDQSCDGQELCFIDGDGDGWRTGDVVASIDVDCADAGEALRTAPTFDCDDSSTSVYPGAPEVPYDGTDQDCDGFELCDVDGDGVDAGIGVCSGTDCADDDDTISPAVTETWYDGVDADCDGWSDYDADFDGHDSVDHGGDDCDDADESIHPSMSEVWYDAIDQDCDAGSDFDQDGDGFDSAVYGGTDCDDLDDAVYPDAPELDDGIDNDCNGLSEDDDTDGDGVTDEDELAIGTDPDLADTDGDGVWDGVELGDEEEVLDTDGDDIIDALDTDDDNDGLDTIDEIGDTEGGSAIDAYPDADGDGTPDFRDTDSDDDGILDSAEGLADTDGDGVADAYDVDSDGDGIDDVDEVDGDTDGDGKVDRLDSDDDGDGVPTSAEDGDADGDGTPDYLDEDSDGDGVSDGEEGTLDSDCDGTPNHLDADDEDGPCGEDSVVESNYAGSACGGASSTGLGVPFGLALLGLLGLRRRRD